MNRIEADAADTGEKLEQKHLERRKQLPPSEDIPSGSSDEAVRRLMLTHRPRRQSKELKCYGRALNELFRAVANHPEQFGSDHSLHGSNEDLTRDFGAAPLQDSRVLFTETDVTLPSFLDNSPGSNETEEDRELQRVHIYPDSCRSSSSLVLVKVYQEMMTIYEQLKLNELSEQNKKLENQSKRVQARLENLQRKYELSKTPRGCQKDGVKSFEPMKPSKNERTAVSGKPSSKGSSSPTPTKLLALLLDWVLDGRTFSSVASNDGKGVEQCLPLKIVLNDRCLQVMPLLADQLHHTPLTEPDLLLSLLRLIHWALKHLDNSAQHVALSATLRRIGEEMSKPAAQSAVLQCEGPALPKSSSEIAGHLRSCPLYQSSCPHTRILSTLIILRTVTQADVRAQALDSLHTELVSEERRGLFLHYGGLCVLLMVLQAGRSSSHTPMDILMQLTEPSRYLNRFLETCSCEEFFRTASQLLKHPRLELPSLEKLSILLQKLSSNRKNRRLFELSSLHLQIQELYHKTNQTHTFLGLNLRSILHNLK
ncbi:hypothetical protein F2P81_021010 [Scophthalmus maximus]|uniref:Coiled-coil domain-containing protein 138 n=1 Tax=Scophthalmus maximus TaxID=52904 RepID=A0A6A4RW45_SCOMX|nr:hypothetical protein F2P81_021010 [Scophthalmus maximus]